MAHNVVLVVVVVLFLGVVVIRFSKYYIRLCRFSVSQTIVMKLFTHTNDNILH